MKNAKKMVILLLALILLVGCAVGGTIAYLMMATPSITNTFTTSDVSITLTETGATNNAQAFKMIPGATIAKDPKVTVAVDSEACYVFVKVTAANGVILSSVEPNAVTDYITYTMAEGWTLVPNQTDVYYRVVTTTDMGTPISILKDNKVQVLSTVTKAMMEAAQTTKPTLTFTAYAVQQEGLTVAQAWAQAQTLGN